MADIVDLLDGEHLSNESRRIDNVVKASRRFRPGPKWKGPSPVRHHRHFRSPRRSELLLASNATTCFR